LPLARRSDAAKSTDALIGGELDVERVVARLGDLWCPRHGFWVVVVVVVVDEKSAERQERRKMESQTFVLGGVKI
jgi:hypothetical protein